MNELKRREQLYELTASIAAADRAEQHHARWRRTLHFVFNAHQVVYEPTVAVPASEVQTPSASGAGSGAAGSRPAPSACATPTVGERLPGRPHLPPPLASRISAGITWT